VLHPGDTLLLEAHHEFVQEQRNSRHFFLVSGVENSAPTRHERAWLALAILAALRIIAGFEWLDMLTAALLAAMLMILGRCGTGSEARQSIDWSVLLVIGASLGIGQALETSGAAEAVAGKLRRLNSRCWCLNCPDAETRSTSSGQHEAIPQGDSSAGSGTSSGGGSSAATGSCCSRISQPPPNAR